MLMRPSQLIILLAYFYHGSASIHTPDSSVLNNLPPTTPSNTVLPLVELRNKLVLQLAQDIHNIDALPQTKLTTPCNLISVDKSNTKAWTFDDWDRHCTYPVQRYARHIRSWPWSSTTHSILPTVFVVLAWSVVILLATSNHSPPIISNLILQSSLSSSLIGAFLSPIALLLSIRANRAVNRLMEVRKAWGMMGKSIRSLTGVIATYGVYAVKQPLQEDGGITDQSIAMITTSLIAARYLAIFGWSMKATFRKDEDDSDIIRAVLPQVEADWLLSSPAKRPIAILSRLRGLIQQLSALGYPITPMIHLTLEKRLYDLEASFGICNRIFMSPIPPTYTRHTSRVLCLFLFLLPINFAGSKTSPAALLLGVAAITYVLVGIDEIGLEIEYVFPLLPMQQMASTYQKNVLNQFMLLSNVPNDNWQW